MGLVLDFFLLDGGGSRRYNNHEIYNPIPAACHRDHDHQK